MSASVAERIRVRTSALGLLADTPVVTLLSGGADSTLLAVSLAELGCAARLVHVAHSLRGAESEADEQACRRLAQQLVEPLRRLPLAFRAQIDRRAVGLHGVPHSVQSLTRQRG